MVYCISFDYYNPYRVVCAMLRFSLTVSYLKLLLDFFPLFHIVSLCNSTLHNPLFSQAERRMVSVYMPDERISMFPYALSTELLSLGAGVDSYALSCGVTLDANGTYVMRENVHRKDVRTNMVQTNGRRERVGYADNASCTHAHTHIDTAYFIQHISSFIKFHLIPDFLFGFFVISIIPPSILFSSYQSIWTQLVRPISDSSTCSTGAVTSFEVCPSRIRITRRLSYSELDDMLAREESNGKILQSLLAGNGVNAESTDPSSSFSQSDSRGGRSNLGGWCEDQSTVCSFVCLFVLFVSCSDLCMNLRCYCIWRHAMPFNVMIWYAMRCEVTIWYVIISHDLICDLVWNTMMCDRRCATTRDAHYPISWFLPHLNSIHSDTIQSTSTRSWYGPLRDCWYCT